MSLHPLKRSDQNKEWNLGRNSFDGLCAGECDVETVLLHGDTAALSLSSESDCRFKIL